MTIGRPRVPRHLRHNGVSLSLTDLTVHRLEIMANTGDPFSRVVEQVINSLFWACYRKIFKDMCASNPAEDPRKISDILYRASFKLNVVGEGSCPENEEINFAPQIIENIKRNLGI